MGKKRFTIKTACPQCGCSYLTVLTDEEIRKKYGDDPKVHMECGECTLQYEAEMADACPEWDKECKMNQ
jgi:hypothetical protein